MIVADHATDREVQVSTSGSAATGLDRAPQPAARPLHLRYGRLRRVAAPGPDRARASTPPRSSTSPTASRSTELRRRSRAPPRADLGLPDGAGRHAHRPIQAREEPGRRPSRPFARVREKVPRPSCLRRRRPRDQARSNIAPPRWAARAGPTSSGCAPTCRRCSRRRHPLLSSTSDAMPMTVLEAMALGRAGGRDRRRRCRELVGRGRGSACRPATPPPSPAPACELLADPARRDGDGPRRPRARRAYDSTPR